MIPGSQVTDSENHPGWNDSHPNGDVGGNFYSQKRFIVINGNDNHPRRFGFDIGVQGIKENYSYDGPVFPVAPSVNDLAARFPSSGEASTAELDKLGTTAISRTEPTNNVINLTTFLGEILREGIPRAKFDLWKERTGDLKQLRKAAGDDYLNVQFGWAPLVRDITSSYNQIANAERVIAQYERDAGRVVRRRYHFPDERSLSYGNYTDLAAPYYGPHQSRLEFPGNSRIIDFETEVVKKRWFSGAYTYYLPSDWVSRTKMKDARDVLSNIFDITPTPESIWNLTPWSWAVDWFTNAGDVFHNVSKFAGDCLVLRYGYMMQHTTAVSTYACRDSRVWFDGTGAPSSVKFVVETKQRRKATPYGFGFNLGALSASQAAILAALGLSKAP